MEVESSSFSFPRIVTAAAGLLIAFLIIYILSVASSLLIPLVFAILFWYLLNTADHALSHIKIRRWQPPRWLRLLLVLTAFALLFNMTAGIVATSVSRVMQAAPQYQTNLENKLHDLPFGLEIEDIPALSPLTEELDIGLLMQRIAREFTGILGNIGLIVIYLVFLFLEQRYFSKKLVSTTASEEKHRRITAILYRIDHDIRRYVGVKTLLSLATALGAWLIMRLVGLDFAEFWALLIFILNFIPNLGSIVATIMPSLLALLQFDTYPPFFIIFFGIGTLQLVIGNLLDPLLMGKSLNVSPLLIIFSLVLWGGIWGLPGLFLCVPITVIAMIILYNFKETRWLALLLSRDGDLES